MAELADDKIHSSDQFMTTSVKYKYKSSTQLCFII